MSQAPQNTRLVDAFKHAGSGIATTIKDERNIKIELCFALGAIVASILLRLEPLEWVFIVVLIALVIALELANSALESMVDLVSPHPHPLAKKAKDAMAGAVLVAALASAVGGCIIFVHAALRLWS